MDGYPTMKKKTKAKKKVTPCAKCKAFTVTPARNSKGRFTRKTSGQKSFKF